MKTANLLIVALVAFANVVGWAVPHGFDLMPRPAAPLSGVSFSPFQADQDPTSGSLASAGQIDQDLALVQGRALSVRTYSSTGGLEQVPGLAQRHGLRVTAGAWLDTDLAKNEVEIASLVANARRYDNIDALIVGNETILRGDLTVPQLIDYLHRVKQQVNLPVSTAEPWHIWIQHPELVQAVDQITVHLLPYWEGAGPEGAVPIEHAVPFVFDRYDLLRRTYPGKHVVIGEVGWPSDGLARGQAVPSLANQTRFVRDFLDIAAQRGVTDYFVVEAVDQPWKTGEGDVGPHWGLFDANRQPKVPWDAYYVAGVRWQWQYALTGVLGLLAVAWLLRRTGGLRFPGRLLLAACVQAVISVGVAIAFASAPAELPLFTRVAWLCLLPAQATMLAILLVNSHELAEVLWVRDWRRRFGPLALRPGAAAPRVSVHVPVCNEPPEIVIRTLESLARLDYPDYEVVVVSNNTADTRLWRPVQDACRRLGERFRFFHLDRWPGYKAGALNFALAQADAAAEVVGVIDSDYVVGPDWLASLAPYFDDAGVGFVQAPQDQRQWHEDPFKAMCNWEYRGFFHIGMVQRNERDAIILHGTMVLIRRAALQAVGGWAEWCLGEDAELGLRLLEHGYGSVYVNQSFGRGLVPDSFAAYKGQRFRWAYNAIQILRRHWRLLLPGSGLTAGQRYHFAAGWLPWLGDALHVLFTVAMLGWSASALVRPESFPFPPAGLVAPAVAIFLLNLFRSLWLYRARVGCSVGQALGASVAGTALAYTVGKAYLLGTLTSDRPFLRTPKGENKPALVRSMLAVREELGLLLALGAAFVAVLLRHGGAGPDAVVWLAVMAIQSVPFAAAVGCAIASSRVIARQRVPLVSGGSATAVEGCFERDRGEPGGVGEAAA